MERHHLKVLAASRWHDGKGSVYDVEVDDHGYSCSVNSTRKNDQSRLTPALIQLRDGRIYWGRNYELQGDPLHADKIHWVSDSKAEFVWRRMANTCCAGRSDERANQRAMEELEIFAAEQQDHVVSGSGATESSLSTGGSASSDSEPIYLLHKLREFTGVPSGYDYLSGSPRRVIGGELSIAFEARWDQLDRFGTIFCVGATNGKMGPTDLIVIFSRPSNTSKCTLTFEISQGVRSNYRRVDAATCITKYHLYRFLCVVNPSGHMRIYQDGLLLAENLHGYAPEPVLRDRSLLGEYIGRSDQCHIGAIGDVRLWNRVVLWTEVSPLDGQSSSKPIDANFTNINNSKDKHNRFAPKPISKELRHAAQKNDLPRIQELLVRRADALDSDGSGRTALHWAARVGALAAVQVFLSIKVDPNIADNTGETPRDEAEWWAVKSKGKDGRDACLAVRQLLERHGATCSDTFLSRRPKLEAWADENDVEVPWKMAHSQVTPWTEEPIVEFGSKSCNREASLASNEFRLVEETRGRASQKAGLTSAEVDDFSVVNKMLQRLRRAIEGCDSSQESPGWMWEELWASIDSLDNFKYRCIECHEDAEQRLLGPVRSLKYAWDDLQLWPRALASVRQVLRRHLEEPSSITILPIQDIKYTHNTAGSVFKHGAHKGQRVLSLADDLLAGRVATTDFNMTLDVIDYHGVYWSLNNRHLKADREYLHSLHAEHSWLVTKESAESASVRVWPLAPGIKLHGKLVMDKFSDALSTRDQGRSLSLRTRASSVASSRSVSQERRSVRFDPSCDRRPCRTCCD